MTLSWPPLGGVTSISRSTPAGGQMTPFDSESLSLKGAELPPPTVGGSPFVPGGHVTPFSGEGLALGCAEPTLTAAPETKAARMASTAYKANSPWIAERIHQRAAPSERSHARCGAPRMRLPVAAGTQRKETVSH